MTRLLKLFFFFAVLFQPFLAYADGFIIVHRPPRIEVRRWHHFPLSVKYHRVHVAIEDQVAVTKIDQVFYNPNHQQLEGTYIFPLPERATLKQFSMFMNGVEVQGELLDKDKARNIYLSIVRRMQDPALLEYVGRGMFRARVFPIPPRGETRIKLAYSELLSAEDNLVEYTYPLNTEKFSSQPLQEVTITVDIKSQLPLKTIYSSTHQIDLVRKGATLAKVGFERKNVLPNKDFKLYFSRSSKEVTLDLLSTKPSSREKGYFLLIVSPHSEFTKDAAIPKDLVFVMDTSGSMMGDKMKQAKKALSYCIQSLGKDDRFAIVDFSTEARAFNEALLTSSDQNKKEALQYIEGITARGGTNIHEALLKAFGMSPKKTEGRPFMVCFMTDGEPTVGVIEPKEIISEVAKANTAKGRLFVLGVGNDLNARLLDKLAEGNRGSRTYIDEKENIEIKVSSFFNKIAYPALSDLKLTFSKNVRVEEIYPKKLADLFVGTQLKIMGRYNDGGSCAITLKGMRLGKEITFVYEPTFNKGKGNGEVPALWANQKISFLLDQIRLNGEKQELKQEIVRLAKKFGIVTPYTSYLVTEDVRRVPSRPGEGGGRFNRMEREKAGAFTPKPTMGANQPESPATRQFNEDKKSAAKSLRKDSGRDAVKGSQMITKQQKTITIEGIQQQQGQNGSIQWVDSKAFYKIGATWVDSRYSGKTKLPQVKVKAFSEEYFKLLEKNTGLGKYLALGNKVIVVYEGTVYMVE